MKRKKVRPASSPPPPSTSRSAKQTKSFGTSAAKMPPKVPTAASGAPRSVSSTLRSSSEKRANSVAPNLRVSFNIWFLSIIAIAPALLAIHAKIERASSEQSGLGSRQEHEFVDEMSDLLTLTPPFAPTRRPLARAGLSVVATAPSSPIRQASAAEQQVPAASSSRRGSSAFVRTNELDAFLDDMNHNELRTVASGRPIEDLFHAKPIPPTANQHGQSAAAAANQPSGYYNLTANAQEASTRAAAATSGNQQERRSLQKGTGLMGSHSEHQIYSECALILQRTYVKNIDDPKHQLVPFGKTEQACISYKHIDKAIEQAKHKLKFKEFARMRKEPIATEPGKPPLAPLDVIHATLEPPVDLIAAIGEINMATTQIIADQFDLSNDELLNGLPLIDMSKTKFWDICPLLVKQELKCELTRFRTFTGHCNNLKRPSWGAAMTPYARYLPPVHPDGIWIPRKSIVSEFTFELGEGHRETHSSIAPSMPLPVFDGEPPALPLPLAPIPGHHHRSGFAPAHVPDFMAHHSSPEADPFGVPSGAGEEALDLAGSVHFMRRAPPLGPMGAGGDEPTIEVADEWPEGEAAMRSHSHSSPFATSAQRPSALAEPPRQQASFSHRHSLAAAPSHMVAHKSSRSIAQELPSARLVTSVVHRDMDVPTHDLSILFMSWGQLLDHDMTRAAQSPSSIKCCPQPDGTPPSKHKLCLPIQVPENDPFYSQFNVRCLEFRRTLAGVRPNCVLGPRVHQNAVTSPIDANFVYGSSQAMADGLRLFRGGRLRDRDWFRREGLKPLLPAQDVDPDADCIARPKDLFCFLAGDVRANEQTHLTVLHTLYMREHNRLADRLAELNPHWDDERIYQEARHIVAAGTQHVMINEYIPLLIGRKMTELYNLTSQPAEHDQRAYWHGYDPSVTTSVANSFAAAAFRQGHTMVQGSIERWNKFHEFVAAEKLRHLFKQPFLLYQPGVLDELTSGLLNQASQQYDPFISADISGHLFQPPELQFGHDLAAINLQRGREQGLPGYNLFREWCGLPRAETFEQLEPYLTNRTAYQYSRLFKHVDDIDLWSGGVSERKLPGAAIGPTFACIIARQFSNTRRGDRFWYENPGLPSSFTPDQLGELRKISLAKILCANSDDLPTIQRWAFRLAHPVLNPRVDCNLLPEMDLQFWQEE